MFTLFLLWFTWYIIRYSTTFIPKYLIPGKTIFKKLGYSLNKLLRTLKNVAVSKPTFLLWSQLASFLYRISSILIFDEDSLLFDK